MAICLCFSFTSLAVNSFSQFLFPGNDLILRPGRIRKSGGLHFGMSVPPACLQKTQVSPSPDQLIAAQSTVNLGGPRERTRLSCQTREFRKVRATGSGSHGCALHRGLWDVADPICGSQEP